MSRCRLFPPTNNVELMCEIRDYGNMQEYKSLSIRTAKYTIPPEERRIALKYSLQSIL